MWTTDLVATKRPKRVVGLGRIGESLRAVRESWRCIVRRHELKSLAIPSEDISKCGIADANGLLQHCCEHRLKIAGRTGDDLEHL